MPLPLPTTRRGWWTLVAAVVVLVGGGLGAVWMDHDWPWHHFRTVTKGRFYRAGQPSADDVEKAVRDYGVKTIVNLRAEAERTEGDWYGPEVRATGAAGAAHVDVPLVWGTPPTPEQVEQLLRVFEDPARQPVLVHCEFGTVRSAAVEGLYRIEVLGESNEQAWERVETWGHDIRGKYPKIYAFIRDYVPRRARSPAPAAAPR